MNSRAVPHVIAAIAVALMGVGSAFSQSNQPDGAASGGTTVKPLVLEKNEGELRTRRIHTDTSISASAQFMLKVSPKNNGSQHLVAGTEVVAPGATLSK